VNKAINPAIPNTMKAVAYKQSLDIDHPAALLDIELATPTPTGRDLLVATEAIAVNPVDFKIRQMVAPNKGENKVLGWDAIGLVVAKAENSTEFEIGDRVFYAGDLNRQGSNAQYHLVDERIVAKAPKNISVEHAVALPLTSITAWELAFEKLGIAMKADFHTQDEVVLITAAAGGVGSILIQLLKQLSNATVIATASRLESKEWLVEIGADHIIDHSQALADQIDQLNLKVTHIASLSHTEQYFEQFVEIIKPFGRIALIDDPSDLDFTLLKPKSLSLCYEFMFSRSMFETDDMHKQGSILANIAKLVDQQIIRSTIGENLGPINAENLIAAHRKLESGTSIGKLVLSGFDN